MSQATLDWLGCATFRLTVGELVVFLDAYMDRVPAAPPVGLTTGDVDRADWVVVGHSHFDHVWGAETIARNTGARILGSYETVRVMEQAGLVHRTQRARESRWHIEPRRLADARVVLSRANARPVRGEGDHDFEITVANTWGHGARAGVVRSALRTLDDLGIEGRIWSGATYDLLRPPPPHRYGP